MIIRNSNIRLGLYENRYRILVGIVAIILVLYMVKTINKDLYENAMASNDNNIASQVSNNSNMGLAVEESVIYGGKISSENQSSYENMINIFIQACNTKNVEIAYNILSKDCKDALYKGSMKLFERNYINDVFDTKKSYSLQAWINSDKPTYKVEIVQDAMITGVIDDKIIQDYYTIVKEDGEYKLCINGYIGRKNINKKVQSNNVTIWVNYKDVYYEYEKYNVEIRNNSEKDILVIGNNSKPIYLYGENDIKYVANLYQINEEDRKIETNKSKTLDITFNKGYAVQNRISYIVFEDIILNEKEYRNAINKNEYSNILKASISL